MNWLLASAMIAPPVPAAKTSVVATPSRQHNCQTRQSTSSFISKSGRHVTTFGARGNPRSSHPQSCSFSSPTTSSHPHAPLGFTTPPPAPVAQTSAADTPSGNPVDGHAHHQAAPQPEWTPRDHASSLRKSTPVSTTKFQLLFSHDLLPPSHTPVAQTSAAAAPPGDSADVRAHQRAAPWP